MTTHQRLTIHVARRTQGQIFLDCGNPILENAIKPRLMEGKREPCELKVSDFDDAMYTVEVRQQLVACYATVGLFVYTAPGLECNRSIPAPPPPRPRYLRDLCDDLLIVSGDALYLADGWRKRRKRLANVNDCCKGDVH